jgi:acyl-CoA thioesterase-2
VTDLDAVLEALTLEPIEVNLFRGQTPEGERGHMRIYGGQVIAQALAAAYQTVEGRLCHSLQAYFIRPGDPKAPVLYEVERSREGRSFTTRRVIAIQHGEQILNLAASFHTAEPGFEHQFEMEEAPPPESVLSDLELFERLKPEERDQLNLPERDVAIEMRRLDRINPMKPQKAEPRQRIWFRTSADVGEDPVLNQCLLAYASDMSLLSTCARPHGVSWRHGVQMASLDHIIWFHRPVRVGEWMMYDQDSPWSGGARGFNRGAIYSRDGKLIASVAQEGLIRPTDRPREKA